jgi:hypothetical protein
LANNEEEEGILLERKKIRWQEAIQRPTFQGGKEESEDEEGEEGIEDEEKNEVEDEEEDEADEKVPEDPAHKQIRPKLGNGDLKR